MKANARNGLRGYFEILGPEEDVAALLIRLGEPGVPCTLAAARAAEREGRPSRPDLVRTSHRHTWGDKTSSNSRDPRAGSQIRSWARWSPGSRIGQNADVDLARTRNAAKQAVSKNESHEEEQ
jgi:hypothetical protein